MFHVARTGRPCAVTTSVSFVVRTFSTVRLRAGMSSGCMYIPVVWTR